MSSDNIQEKLDYVRSRIAAAAEKSGRSPDEVLLIAVSKTVTAAIIAQAYACGLRSFGENRVRELELKAAALPPDCEWHLIGHLQKNKVRPVLECARWIHSVDSIELLQRLERLALESGVQPDILLQVNVSGEESKFGLAPELTVEFCEAAMACRACKLQGLMTMAPWGQPEAELRRVFAGLRILRDRLAADFGTPMPELSMGMSGDYEPAIAEGATMVRIGTAIFGSV